MIQTLQSSKWEWKSPYTIILLLLESTHSASSASIMNPVWQIHLKLPATLTHSLLLLHTPTKAHSLISAKNYYVVIQVNSVASYSYSPEHSSPFPVKPARQVHSKLPALFTQLLFSSQGSSSHSFNSASEHVHYLDSRLWTGHSFGLELRLRQS